MKRTSLILVVALLTATTALAHQGVQNRAVLARMNGMSAIAENIKVLGDMAKRKAAFDVEAARVALQRMADHAGEAPALFEAREDDPKSEALPAIWDDFDDFTAKAMELEQIASDAAASLSSAEDLPPLLQKLGANCKSCHSIYRE